MEELPDGNNSVFVSLHAHTSRLIIGEAKPEKFSMVVQQHLHLWKPAFPSAEEPQQAEGRVNSFTLSSQPLGKSSDCGIGECAHKIGLGVLLVTGSF